MKKSTLKNHLRQLYNQAHESFERLSSLHNYVIMYLDEYDYGDKHEDYVNIAEQLEHIAESLDELQNLIDEVEK